MSYDLFVWCEPPAPNAEAAFELLDAVAERTEITPLQASPRVTAFLEELFNEHPPLETVEAAECVWSFTDDRSDRHALLSMQTESAQRVTQRILYLAAKHRLRCFDPQTLADWIYQYNHKRPHGGLARSISALPSDVLDEFRQLVSYASVGRPSAELWGVLWEALKQLRPERAADLAHERRRARSEFDFGDPAAAVYFQARDAIGIALEAAGISRHGVFADLPGAYWQDAPLSSGLSGGLTEDVVLHHDARRIPGFVLAQDVGDSFRFRQRRHALDVTIVNRRPFETASRGGF